MTDTRSRRPNRSTQKEFSWLYHHATAHNDHLFLEGLPVVKPRPCFEVDLPAFSRWARTRRRLAENTVRNYLVWISDAEQYLHRHSCCLDQAEPECLRRYLDTLPPTPSTRNCAVAALKAFYTFHLEDDGARLGVVSGLHIWPTPPSEPQPLELEQVGPYLDECYADCKMLGVLSVLFLGTSLRLDELRTRRKSHLVGARRLSVTRKGGKQRIVILSDECLETLTDWLRNDCPPDSRWMFPSPRRRDQPISAGWVYTHVREAGENAGIVNMHPHRLRHTGITEYYRLTKDPAATQRYAGHSTFATTQGYIQLVDAESDPFIANLRFRNSSR